MRDILQTPVNWQWDSNLSQTFDILQLPPPGKEVEWSIIYKLRFMLLSHWLNSSVFVLRGCFKSQSDCTWRRRADSKHTNLRIGKRTVMTIWCSLCEINRLSGSSATPFTSTGIYSQCRKLKRLCSAAVSDIQFCRQMVSEGSRASLLSLCNARSFCSI